MEWKWYNKELIRKCLDLDEWEYSRHVDPSDTETIKKIIVEKLQKRLEEIDQLALCLLHLTENVTIYHEDEHGVWLCHECDWTYFPGKRTNLDFSYCPNCGRKIEKYYYWEEGSGGVERK